MARKLEFGVANMRTLQRLRGQFTSSQQQQQQQQSNSSAGLDMAAAATVTQLARATGLQQQQVGQRGCGLCWLSRVAHAVRGMERGHKRKWGASRPH
jgi:hypothetical protein